MSNRILQSTSLDKLAVLLSGICILHCLITPIAITLLPILAISTAVEEVLFHQLMLWLVVPSSAIALLIGCRKHRNFSILASGIVGMAILIIIAFWAHDFLSLSQERIATSVGGIILAISHILNYRACQAQTCSDDQCASKHHH